MRFDDVAERVAGVPHMTRKQGKTLYDFILTNKRQRILELGFASGVSTCYMAAALDELGSGEILTLDRKNALDRDPTIHDLLEKCGLGHLATPVFADTSYTWALLHLLERDPLPSYDFVFVDGAHTWDVDGFAFLLADRLIEAGGWVLFDDLDWTLETSPTLRTMQWVRKLPDEQRVTAQVRKVYELLVKTDSTYDSHREEDGWAWARKVAIR